MKFQSYDLGYLSGGEVVEVSLAGNAANIKLMDSANFNNYKNGRQHKFFGGQATRSPVRLQVPNAGFWHIAVDLGGFAGQTRSSVRVIK